MPRSYKHSNKRVVPRSSNGTFRKTTLEDIGIFNGNTNGDTYICNICGYEFIPVTKSYKCCGVNDIRVKEKIYNDEQKEILIKIDLIKNKPFINRQDLRDMEELTRELYAAGKKK